MNRALRLIEVSNQSELLKQIFSLRVEVWRRFIDVDSAVIAWTDEFDAKARHWAVLDGDTLAAAARLSIHSRVEDVPDSEVYRDAFISPLTAPIASMNRLVVDARYRGRGLSTSLDEARIKAAELAGCRCVIGHTHAGDKRLAQLESEGFQNLGAGKANERGIVKGHVGVVIYCPLPRRTTAL